MFLFDNELFERREEMLEYALRNGIVSGRMVFFELEGLAPEDVVQIVMDYADVPYLCDCLLDYEQI